MTQSLTEPAPVAVLVAFDGPGKLTVSAPAIAGLTVAERALMARELGEALETVLARVYDGTIETAPRQVTPESLPGSPANRVDVLL